MNDASSAAWFLGHDQAAVSDDHQDQRSHGAEAQAQLLFVVVDKFFGFAVQLLHVEHGFVLVGFLPS